MILVDFKKKVKNSVAQCLGMPLGTEPQENKTSYQF